MAETWRIGRHFPIHIYEGEDIPVATALTVAYAEQIVADHNSAASPPQPDALKLAEARLESAAEGVTHFAWSLVRGLGPDATNNLNGLLIELREALAAIRAAREGAAQHSAAPEEEHAHG